MPECREGGFAQLFASLAPASRVLCRAGTWPAARRPRAATSGCLRPGPRVRRLTRPNAFSISIGLRPRLRTPPAIPRGQARHGRGGSGAHSSTAAVTSESLLGSAGTRPRTSRPFRHPLDAARGAQRAVRAILLPTPARLLPPSGLHRSEKDSLRPVRALHGAFSLQADLRLMAGPRRSRARRPVWPNRSRWNFTPAAAAPMGTRGGSSSPAVCPRNRRALVSPSFEVEDSDRRPAASVTHAVVSEPPAPLRTAASSPLVRPATRILAMVWRPAGASLSRRRPPSPPRCLSRAVEATAAARAVTGALALVAIAVSRGARGRDVPAPACDPGATETATG